jgi:DNA mismatch repair protein MutS2
MRERDLVALEFHRVREHLTGFARSPAGKEACLALRPSAERDAAERRIERTAQSVALIERHGRPPLEDFPDIRLHLRSAAHEGFVLDGKALVDVRRVLRTAREVRGFFRGHLPSAPALDDLAARVAVFPLLEGSLARALDDGGQVLDGASDELARVRKTIRALRDRITRKLEALVDRSSMADVVSDTFVTIRNNRFVVPIRAGAAGRVAGVVQDRSMSGETFFVEPLFAVDLNNELLLAVREEEAIVRRILADLTALVRAEHDGIGATFAALVEVDCLLAQASFARAYRCTMPVFTGAEIRLCEARHPVLLFTGREVTPIDLLLSGDKRVLVITGPNTGGKTVALKTLGLCALMAQSGFLLCAAEGARLPCFSNVFADVGDEQNIERNLSTFSGHVANLCDILAHDLRTALVLLDEPGVGTDPDEGSALAIGLLQQLERAEARVAITTHFNAVKLFALADPSCAVAAVDFDVDTLTPLYRLAYHSLGRSLALPIAERLGLPAAVLVAARAAQSHDSRAFAGAIDRLEATRRGYEQELDALRERSSALAASEAEAQRLLDEVRQRRRAAWSEELREARDFVRTLKAEGRQVIAELQRGADRAVLQRFVSETERAIAARGEEPRVAADKGAGAESLQRGDLVELKERGLRGELLSIEGERAWIQRGTLRFEVPAAELRRVGREEKPAVRVRLPSHDAAAAEISLLGLRAREAVGELEQFLDRSIQAGRRTVRIIHGIGSGALKRAVHDYLSTSPYCSAFRAGESGEGGDGVTIAELDAGC